MEEDIHVTLRLFTWQVLLSKMTQHWGRIQSELWDVKETDSGTNFYQNAITNSTSLLFLFSVHAYWTSQQEGTKMETKMKQKQAKANDDKKDIQIKSFSVVSYYLLVKSEYATENRKT